MSVKLPCVECSGVHAHFSWCYAVLVDELRARAERAEAEVERLRESVKNLDELYVGRTDELREALAELRTVAQRQREACAKEAERQDRDSNGNCPWPDVLLTPLVTED